MQGTCSLPQPKTFRHQQSITCSKITNETLRNSLLTGLPKISREKSGLLKLIRIAVTIICIIGFFYQMLIFFQYHAYQVCTERTVTDVGNLVAPVFTVCARSPGSRRKYCEANSSRCETYVGEMFCLFNPNFCENGTSFSFPLAFTERDYLNTFTPPNIFYGGNETFAYVHYAYNKGLDYLPCISPNMYGYSIEETENFSSVYISQHYDAGTEFYISYDLKDILTPKYASVIILGIHSPFDTQFSEIELELGKKYEIQIRVEQHKLLLSPYATDCRDYIYEFTTNNFTGPWSKQVCLQLCNIQPYLDVCGCAPLNLLKKGKIFPFDLLCQTDEDYTCFANVSFSIERRQECYFTCKNDCEKWTYHTDVVQRMQTYVEDPAIISVVLRLEESQLTIVSYRPKYEIIELVSYIGGYLAFWLGFCMISMADFLFSIFKTLVELFCKHRN